MTKEAGGSKKSNQCGPKAKPNGFLDCIPKLFFDFSTLLATISWATSNGNIARNGRA